MKIENRLYPDQLSLWGGKLKKDETWMSRLSDFLPKLNELIQEAVKDEDRMEYGDDLARFDAHLANFTYLVRKERDLALAKGYQMYPKGEYNSDAQVALARQYASEEVRLRELLADLGRALHQRMSINTTAITVYREGIKHG